nr:MAG TPA: hypothetical protein [Caudoviricetes sp.]
MAKEVTYNNTLVSGTADETLTYTRYIKDESSGKSVKESLDEKVNKSDQLGTTQIADNAITNEKLAEHSVDNSKLSQDSVSYDKILNGAVITEKIQNGAVTTEKVGEKTITNPKLGDQSVDGRVVREASLESKHFANESVTTEKVARKSITNDKIADGTLKKDKLDPELRKAIESATGLPDELVGMIQDVDENLAKLNDTVYPIILGFTITPNVGTMQTEVRYSVSSDNKPIVPDTSIISKQINDNAAINISTTPSSGGTLSTPIEGAREIFKYAVTKKGRTGKSTSQTRYLCYFGGNPTATMTAEILNTLNKVSAIGVSFNPKVTTKDNDYIWLVVPSYLSITRVTSAGFDVTLAAPQTITNSLGSFKAYRTANPLTAATWNLVIS